MSLLLALAGPPNCGKSTLFGRLTGAEQPAGNWPGVTVTCRLGEMPAPFADIAVADLPGAYSLAPRSAEEAAARDFLLSGRADALVAVVDATAPERGLYLALELLELGRPIVLALNLMDESARRGDRYDLPALSRLIGAPIVPISARTGAGLDALIRAAKRAAENRAAHAHAPSASAGTAAAGAMASSASAGTAPAGTMAPSASAGTAPSGAMAPSASAAPAPSSGAARAAQGRAFSAGAAEGRAYSHAPTEKPSHQPSNASIVGKPSASASTAPAGAMAPSASAGSITSDAMASSVSAGTAPSGEMPPSASAAPAPWGGAARAAQGPDCAPAAIRERYARVETILCACLHRGASRRAGRSERIDRVLLHRFWALPLLALALWLVFHLAFGPLGARVSAALGGWLENGRALLAAGLLRGGASPWVRGLLLDGAYRGVSGVLAFLPTLALLFTLLALLEDSGYMARAAFLMDKPLRWLGLNGRAFIPLLLGFGCTVPAVMNARCLASPRDRRLTVLLTPLMSCGAKAPLYALLAGTVWPGHAEAVAGGVYALGVLLAALAGRAARHTPLHGGDEPFLLELPEYRAPTLLGVLRQVGERMRDFIRRALTVVLLASLAVWFLRAYTPALAPATGLEGSLLGLLAGALAPLLRPAGIGDARAVAALLMGLLAKENIPGALAVLSASGQGAAFPSPLSAACFMAFTLLYPPCAAALAAIRRELGGARWAAAVALAHTLLAWTLCTLLYQAGLLLGWA